MAGYGVDSPKRTKEIEKVECLKKCLNGFEMSKAESLIVEFFNNADSVQVDEGTWYYSESSVNSELMEVYTQLARANERVKELEKELSRRELMHVGFTNGTQINYAKTEEGSFYPDTVGNCYIPLYMLKSHEHRIETTSIEQLRKEQE